MDLEKLRKELAGKQYGNLSDGEAAALLNAPTEATVSRGVISREQFVAPMARGLAQMLGKPDPAFTGWLELLKLLPSVDTAAVVHTEALAAAVAAGLLTQAEVDVALLRPCSRAEELCGCPVTESDVAAALHEGRQAVYEAGQAAIRQHAEKLMAADEKMGLREAMERADQELNNASWGHDVLNVAEAAVKI